MSADPDRTRLIRLMVGFEACMLGVIATAWLVPRHRWLAWVILALVGVAMTILFQVNRIIRRWEP